MALIFLTDEQNDRLDQLARTTGKSRAELEQELSSAIDNWMTDIESGGRLSEQEALRREWRAIASRRPSILTFIVTVLVVALLMYL